MGSEIRVVLLATLPVEDWGPVRDRLAQFQLAEDQRAFGGNPADFIDLESEPNRTVFLIYADHELVGVGSLLSGEVDAALWPMQTPAVQLRGFVIDGRMQGLGIGTTATKQVCELARDVDPNAEYLVLTVNQRNPGARRTYEKAGFLVWPSPYLGGPVGPQDIMYVALPKPS